ncbi:response regulator [Cohnella sp. CBP 2801]|uniref:histidine kinase n=2 Tax=Cohnella zeiphila TaxID=2761120 RepID=A0A7X0VWV1_9BACL|nr:ATP-binding protein [Cohnella zeiphila]MBB6731273.1 response regulator [Cohnella zeiphila]
MAVWPILFVVVLTVSRLAWLSAFHHEQTWHAVKGQLDLREWNAADGGTISLDGQWAFYPGSLLADSQEPQGRAAPDYVQVPGGWNDSLRAGADSPYGYGTYKLVIRVDPGKDYTYAIRLTSVRSSSMLYVNGRLLGQSGQPAADKKDYSPGNNPYSASFTPDRDGVIEIAVEAANYEDPRDSGMIRSVRFGTENAVDRESRLSMSMQEMVAVVFLMQAVYALILFLAGRRENSLLYFALLAVFAMANNLLGSEEKLLSFWFPIGYAWSFKLVYFALTGVAFSLLRCVASQLPASWRRIVSWHAVLCGIAGALALLLDTRPIMQLQPLFVATFAISVGLTVVALFRASVRNLKDSVSWLLAILAFASHLVWLEYYLVTSIKVVYYPFDLIAAMACFASVWIRRYFQVHSETVKLADKLQRADKLKDQFLANTSHELRNPLHGILNVSQAVLEREQRLLRPESVKDLETVLSVGRRMSLMLNDLLDVMSLREGAPRVQRSSFRLQSIAAGVLDMFRLMTEGKPVRLTNRIPDSFPLVFADENRVIQILFNLLHNAVKFTAEGEVTIQGHVRDGKAHIAVSDTGAGMDEETMRRMFEPYEQGDPDRTMIEGGFGLGLSISKQLVELHGGTLRAESVPGRGTEFVFTLPLSDVPDDARKETEISASDPALAAAEAAAASEVSGGSNGPAEPGAPPDLPRILVVDDDPVNLKVVESILSPERLYETKTATSGKEALAMLDEREWDLVVADVMMPGMSGYELTRSIRRRHSVTDLPVLLLTARSQPEDIENGFRAGANDYVTKPVDAMELRSRVKSLTDVKQSVRERLRMEAAWLQAQIQPHFLFNALNSVAALSEVDSDRMRSLLEAFGHFLRNKFKLHRMDELIPVEEELSIVRSYLHIEKERFGDRLRIAWDIDDTAQLSLPPLTIQPLVENAVRHGVMKRAGGGRLLIKLADFGTYAEIAVVDDGAGMDAETLRRVLAGESAGKSGIGLSNTDLRLKRRYGQGLQIKSEPGRGTSVSFVATSSAGGTVRPSNR